MDTECFKIFVNELADMSGEYIAKNFGHKLSVDLKKDSSPVTEIDRNTEIMKNVLNCRKRGQIDVRY